MLYDFLFSEADRSAEGDAKFVEAVRGGRVVLGAFFTDALTGANFESPAGFATAGDDPRGFAPHFRGALRAALAEREEAL